MRLIASSAITLLFAVERGCCLMSIFPLSHDVIELLVENGSETVFDRGLRSKVPCKCRSGAR